MEGLPEGEGIYTDLLGNKPLLTLLKVLTVITALRTTVPPPRQVTPKR
jgi:hypothetical protein